MIALGTHLINPYGRRFRVSNGGGCLDPKEARDYLIDMLASGQEFIPLAPCDNFDPKSGCLGHPVGG